MHQMAIQVSSLAEPDSSGLEGEIHMLKSDRNALMQEIIRLQEENLATVQQMDSLELQMQSAEQRQKQLVSFLAKVLQNPEFLVHLRQRKELSLIASPRVKRKFLKHTPSSSTDPMGSINQGLESRLGSADASSSSALQDPEFVMKKEIPDNVLSDLVEKLGLEADAGQLVEVLEQTEDDTLAPLFLDDRIMLSMEMYSTDYTEANCDSSLYYPSFSQGINIAKTTSDAIVTATERTLSDVESLQFNKRNVIGSSTDATSGASEYLVSLPDLPFKEKMSAEEPIKETILEQEEEWEAVLEAGQRYFTYEENVWDAIIQDPDMREVTGFDMPWDLELQTPDDHLEKGDAAAGFPSLECGEQSAPS